MSFISRTLLWRINDDDDDELTVIGLLITIHCMCRGQNVFLQANVLVRFAAHITNPTPRCQSLAKNGELCCCC